MFTCIHDFKWRLHAQAQGAAVQDPFPARQAHPVFRQLLSALSQVSSRSAASKTGVEQRSMGQHSLIARPAHSSASSAALCNQQKQGVSRVSRSWNPALTSCNATIMWYAVSPYTGGAVPLQTTSDGR